MGGGCGCAAAPRCASVRCCCDGLGRGGNAPVLCRARWVCDRSNSDNRNNRGDGGRRDDWSDGSDGSDAGVERRDEVAMTAPTDLVWPTTGWVGRSVVHESAHLHVSGHATYLDDAPQLQGTLHCALGLSPVAHGRLLSVDTGFLQAMPGVVAVLQATDIPGENNIGSLAKDDPALAFDRVQYFGQPAFAVLATTRDLARRAAAQASKVVMV